MLADYLGGALDGTAEHAEVARRVAQDPAWARAHALLAPAVDSVRAELAGWGEPTLPLPSEITDRISAALAAADPVVVPATEHAAAATGQTRHQTGDVHGSAPNGGKVAPVPAQPGGSRRPPGSLRPGQDRTSSSRPGHRRRRWARLSGPVALATAAVVGLGVLQLLQPGRGEDAATDTALDDRAVSPTARHAYPEDSAEQPGTLSASEHSSAASGAPYQVVGPPQRSDVDYTPEVLARTTPSIKEFSSGTDPGPGAESQERLAGPGDLTRLGGQAALSACLAEIGAEHSAGPLIFDIVEYARFQGQPALVVQFTDASGTSWAWVSGPECGVPGSGSDARYRTRVG
nr:hypothetical protein [Micromonospora sp. HNM0581]